MRVVRDMEYVVRLCEVCWHSEEARAKRTGRRTDRTRAEYVESYPGADCTRCVARQMAEREGVESTGPEAA